jgi:hypothetical protein
MLLACWTDFLLAGTAEAVVHTALALAGHTVAVVADYHRPVAVGTELHTVAAALRTAVERPDSVQHCTGVAAEAAVRTPEHLVVALRNHPAEMDTAAAIGTADLPDRRRPGPGDWCSLVDLRSERIRQAITVRIGIDNRPRDPEHAPVEHCACVSPPEAHLPATHNRAPAAIVSRTAVRPAAASRTAGTAAVVGWGRRSPSGLREGEASRLHESCESDRTGERGHARAAGEEGEQQMTREPNPRARVGARHERSAPYDSVVPRRQSPTVTRSRMAGDSGRWNGNKPEDRPPPSHLVHTPLPACVSLLPHLVSVWHAWADLVGWPRGGRRRFLSGQDSGELGREMARASQEVGERCCGMDSKSILAHARQVEPAPQHASSTRMSDAIRNSSDSLCENVYNGVGRARNRGGRCGMVN